jgi:hypothetical protein
MASGFGLQGRSKCYETFEAFTLCVNNYAIHPSQCIAYREDYGECMFRIYYYYYYYHVIMSYYQVCMELKPMKERSN